AYPSLGPSYPPSGPFNYGRPGDYGNRGISEDEANGSYGGYGGAPPGYATYGPTMTSKLTLYCLVDGLSTSYAFHIKIEPTETVADLKKDIHSEKPVVFSHVDANDLTLWRVSLTNDDGESAIALDALDGKEKLHPRTQLSKLFPSTIDENTYIIVQPPTQVIEPIPVLLPTCESQQSRPSTQLS
ncbi:hypothetical protein BGX27_004970, partial [Mortierella sp. AM989]